MNVCCQVKRDCNDSWTAETQIFDDSQLNNLLKQQTSFDFTFVDFLCESIRKYKLENQYEEIYFRFHSRQGCKKPF